MHHRLVFVAAAVALTVACGGNDDPVSVGENEPAKTGELLSDYAASWDGYVEAYQFKSGSDRVRITLSEEGVGTLEVGAATLGPPTDPDVGYGEEVGASPPIWIQEGFAYTVNASVQNARMQFSAVNEELYDAWCAIQMRFPGSDTCSGNLECDATGACSTWTEAAPELVPIDRSKGELCGYCRCDADTCWATHELENITTFDGVLVDDGQALVGTLVTWDVFDGQTVERLTVRLQRQ